MTDKYKSTDDLKPHSKNKEIYGAEKDITDILNSIKVNGILEPIAIKEDNTILAGHRRWLAAKELGLEKVPVRTVEFDNKEDEIIFIIESNNQREKTFSQKMRESMLLEEIVKQQAMDRMKNPTQNFAQGETGEANEKLGERLGWSKETYRQAKKIWEASEDGKKEAQIWISYLDDPKSKVSVWRVYKSLTERDSHGIRVKEGQEEAKKIREEQTDQEKQEEIEDYKDRKTFVDKEKSERKAENLKETKAEKELEKLTWKFEYYTETVAEMAKEIMEHKEIVKQILEEKDKVSPGDKRWNLERSHLQFGLLNWLEVFKYFGPLLEELDLGGTPFTDKEEREIAVLVNKAEEIGS